MIYHIMCKDINVTDIITNEQNLVISIKKYVPDGVTQPFWGTFNDTNIIYNTNRFYSFLKERCYEDERRDLKTILDIAGLKTNNPYEWVKITHGVTYEDFFWIKFNNEKITWNDVKVRN